MFYSSLIFLQQHNESQYLADRAKFISVAKSAEMATHPLPTRIENLGQGDKFTENTPVPYAGLLQSQLYFWCHSQECRVKQLHWEQAFLHVLCLLR